MSVNSYLEDLSSSLVLKDEEKSSIELSITTLQRRLDSYFANKVIEQHRFGSSTRGTILPRKTDENSDIDYMIVFNTSDYTYKPQTYLNYLKDFAEKYYSSSEIHQSNPVVVLELNHIKFDLVPARKENYYYSSAYYYIPSPSNYLSEWKNTDPWGYDQELLAKNKNHNYKIKPLIRIMKYWNSLVGHAFISFDLEKYITNSYFSYENLLSEFFYTVWSNFSIQSGWPQRVIDAVTKVKNEVSEIKDLDYRGYDNQAEERLRKIIQKV